MITSEDRQRLGEHVQQARAAMRLSITDAASRARVSPNTWRGIERGTDADVRDLTYRGVEDALNWEPGSVGRILAGGKPVTTGPAPRSTPGEPRKVDHIAEWEAGIIDEIWSRADISDELKEDLTSRARRKAAEARVIEDRLRRSAG